MKPTYVDNYYSLSITDLLDLPWLQETPNRQECFMSLIPRTYTYGKRTNARTYSSIPFTDKVKALLYTLNATKAYNACFLNKYDTDKQHLGWHSDDFPEMVHEHPIAVYSVGEPREIWWRLNNFKGEIPQENRQLLQDKSLFIMPANFQQSYQHKIPKGSKPMSMRISLTFRRFIYYRDNEIIKL